MEPRLCFVLHRIRGNIVRFRADREAIGSGGPCGSTPEPMRVVCCLVADCVRSQSQGRTCINGFIHSDPRLLMGTGRFNPVFVVGCADYPRGMGFEWLCWPD